MRILLIDDDVQFLRAFARRNCNEHEITTASSASQAFIALADRQFDVILCDIHMPEIDGFAFAKKLSPLHADSVVFITGDTESFGKSALPHPTLWKCSSQEEMNAVIAAVANPPYRRAG